MSFLRSPSVLTLAQSGAAASCGADTTEDTLATIVIPAGAMGANGRVEITTLWDFTNSANNKTMRVKFGGTTYLSLVQTTQATAQWLTIVQNANATNAQVAYFNTTATYSTTSGPILTSAVDTTADVTILLTGQKATSGETLTLKGYSVRLVR